MAAPSLAEPSPSETPPARQSSMGRMLVLLNRLLLIAAALPPIGWIAGRFWWPVDLWSHFPLQAAVGALVATLVFAGSRRWRFAACAAIVFAVDAAPLVWEFVPVAQPAASGAKVRVCTVNTFVDNLDGARVVEMLRAENPDVVYVSELTWTIDRALRESGLFPHIVSRPEEQTPWGAGIYSRVPIRRSSWLPTEFGCPTLVADLEIGGQSLTVAGAHPPPPAGGRFTTQRNRMLNQAAQQIAATTGPVLLCGDLNTTPWSHCFRGLLRVSGLRDARNGHGLQLTWPSHRLPLRIPIDHVLVSSGIAVRSHHVARNVGSDHFPVVVDLQLPEPPRDGASQPSVSAMR